MKSIVLAGGCFWGVEEYFRRIEGILETEVGYANGNGTNPSYEEVCGKDTGFAEAVKLTYDESKICLQDLLKRFFKIIDPTVIDRQGPDIGNQYRTGIYYTDESDKNVIEEELQRQSLKYKDLIVTENELLINYYPAEEYHQQYLRKNPNGYCHIDLSIAAEELEKKYYKKSKDELAELLTDEQFEITQNNGTEKPFTGEYNQQFELGIYVDITTGEPLFISTDKFDAGCGWPSFSKPINQEVLQYLRDLSRGRDRTEVRSKLGDAHLGHVFNDGPEELGGLRYCINSGALKFIPKNEMKNEGYGYLIKLLDGQ